MKIYVLIDDNNVITSWAKSLSETHIPLPHGIRVETEINIDDIDLVGKYKLENGTLVELPENEKPKPTEPPTDKMSILEGKVKDLTEQNETLNGAISELTMIVAMGSM